ncbi:hypothetical protein B0H14DRAFT_3466142 [Mycena olivaceomarginata]|nr:hypothetical protein B0H14DRAFT_3466142 [Mycena olivaceomarginata]
MPHLHAPDILPLTPPSSTFPDLHTSRWSTSSFRRRCSAGAGVAHSVTPDLWMGVHRDDGEDNGAASLDDRRAPRRALALLAGPARRRLSPSEPLLSVSSPAPLPDCYRSQLPRTATESKPVDGSLHGLVVTARRDEGGGSNGEWGRDGGWAMEVKQCMRVGIAMQGVTVDALRWSLLQLNGHPSSGRDTVRTGSHLFEQVRKKNQQSPSLEPHLSIATCTPYGCSLLHLLRLVVRRPASRKEESEGQGKTNWSGSGGEIAGAQVNGNGSTRGGGIGDKAGEERERDKDMDKGAEAEEDAEAEEEGEDTVMHPCQQTSIFAFHPHLRHACTYTPAALSIHGRLLCIASSAHSPPSAVRPTFSASPTRLLTSSHLDLLSPSPLRPQSLRLCLGPRLAASLAHLAVVSLALAQQPLTLDMAPRGPCCGVQWLLGLAALTGIV